MFGTQDDLIERLGGNTGIDAGALRLRRLQQGHGAGRRLVPMLMLRMAK